jgi:uncharacterized protein YdhG (YjbR/CyaY superfamily)
MEKKAKNIDSYLEALPEDVQECLRHLREVIIRTAPDAIEVISYSMPAFKCYGRVLVSFASFKNHCSLFPWNASTIEHLQKDLKKFTTAKGTIRFTVDQPIPDALVRKIVKIRLKENLLKSKK